MELEFLLALAPAGCSLGTNRGGWSITAVLNCFVKLRVLMLKDTVRHWVVVQGVTMRPERHGMETIAPGQLGQLVQGHASEHDFCVRAEEDFL